MIERTVSEVTPQIVAKIRMRVGNLFRSLVGKQSRTGSKQDESVTSSSFTSDSGFSGASGSSGFSGSPGPSDFLK